MSNWGLGVLLRDTSTRPGWDRTGNPPIARRQLLPSEPYRPIYIDYFLKKKKKTCVSTNPEICSPDIELKWAKKMQQCVYSCNLWIVYIFVYILLLFVTVQLWTSHRIWLLLSQSVTCSQLYAINVSWGSLLFYCLASSSLFNYLALPFCGFIYHSFLEDINMKETIIWNIDVPTIRGRVERVNCWLIDFSASPGSRWNRHPSGVCTAAVPVSPPQWHVSPRQLRLA